MSALDINIKLSFRVTPGNIPIASEQCKKLLDFAIALEAVGIPLDCWCLPVGDAKGSERQPAFVSNAPSEALHQELKSENKDNPDSPSFGLWNGNQRGREAAFTVVYDDDVCLSSLAFQSDGLSELGFYTIVADLLERTLQIWPAIVGEVGPYNYWNKKVFRDRPGVGWMLYLPRRIEIDQVPEARMIRYVKDLNGTEGSIIISEVEGPFDAENPTHVKVANAIEIRLADQDLLPRYVDL